MAQPFELQLKVATAGLEPQAISALLARTAREALAETIRDGQGSEEYVRSVNGRIGAEEESVAAPGPIVYTFSWLAEAALYALAFAEARSPVASGRYRHSWFALVNGARWDGTTPIPFDAEVIVSNTQPYHRKIETGGMKASMPPYIVEDTRQALLRRYPDLLRVQRQFIPLAGGYILKGQHRLAQRNSKSSAFRAGRKYLSTRKDRAAGSEMTYPAVVMETAL